MRILIVKMSSMGDVVHTLPAVTDALTNRTDLEIDWCVESAFAPLVRLNPGVGTVHEIALRRWRKAPFAGETLRAVVALLGTLRRGRYDLVIDAQGLIKSAIVARLVGAPVHGFDRRSVREGLSSLLYGHRHAVGRDLHAIDRTRLLFGAVLGYRPDLGKVDYGLSSQANADQRTAVLLHGTTWSSKRWPTASWIALAESLLERGITPEVTFADAEEETTARAIAAGAPGTRLLPKSPLVEVADRIARASAVVGCDTGLTHLAAAFGLPTLALFLSTAPGLTGVVGLRARTLTTNRDCAPCRQRRCPLVPDGEMQPCAADLSPERVVGVLDELMDTPR